MHSPIYLDYAATTPVAPEVAERMLQCLTMDGNFANPASRAHIFGWQAEEAVEDARGQVAELIHADPREIVFTSGATESNNLALKGVALARKSYGKHIVTSAIEHKAILDTCQWLEGEGFVVTYLKPRPDGTIDESLLKLSLREDTVLVSVMHVNNELGSINNIAAIGAVCRERNIAFHVDAAQGAGKLPIDVSEQNVDLLSISAHKMYGPKGVGALYVRRSADVKVLAQIHGGGHERGMRSGTLPTHQIVGLGVAAKLAMQQMSVDKTHLASLRERFWAGIAHLPGVAINGVNSHASSHSGSRSIDALSEDKYPGILNISFGDLDGEMLLIALQGLAVSTGSACTSASVEPSYVLKALGLDDTKAHSSLRFSFGRYTTEQDIDDAIAIVCNGIEQVSAQNGLASAR